MKKFYITILGCIGIIIVWVMVCSVNLMLCNREFETSYAKMLTYGRDTDERKEWNDYSLLIGDTVMDTSRMLSRFTYLTIRKESPDRI